MSEKSRSATDPYGKDENRTNFLLEVLRRVSSLPGVEFATIGGNDSLPMNSGRNNNSPFAMEGRASESEQGPIADIALVDTQYFRALEVPLVAGRAFTDSDSFKNQQVVVIDQTLSRRYWPNESPLGRHLKLGRNPQAPWVTIVGVVGDIKSDGFDAPSVPHIYMPLRQAAPFNAVVFIRSKTEVATLGESVRRAVESVDPNIPVHSISSMDQIISRSLADRRFAIELLGVFAAVALLLAAIGIYGVMSYSFSQRTHEIGIRVALGAQRLHILRMALGEGMQLVAIGLPIGLIAAAALTRFVRTMLFEVSPFDPLTFTTISATLAGVALLACFLPARRATRVDPLVALREE